MDTDGENVVEFPNDMPLEGEDLTEQGDDGKLIWDESHIEVFILRMEEEVRVGNRTNSTFNTIGWRNLVEGMRLETGKVYTKIQLRNKFNQLRAIYKDFKKLLSETGVGFNSETGMVIVEDERWERLNKVVKNARKFRRKGCPHYSKMATIFGDTYATGAHVHPSTRAPTTSRVATHHVGIHDLDESDDFAEVDGREISPSQALSNKKAKKNNSFHSTMSQVMVTMTENANMKAERIEKAIAAASSSNLAASCDKGIEVTSPVKKDKEKEMFNSCIKMLDELQGIDNYHYTKASMMFHDSDMWRGFFLNMPEERRVGWIMNL